MNRKTVVLAIIMLMVVGSFGAVGTNSEKKVGNDCGCGTNSVSTDTGNSGRGLGEIPSEKPLPPGEVIDGPAPLVTSLDWRNKDGYDWTTPIRAQGDCGSCYAFGSYGAMEACLDIRDNQPNRNIDLSEQFMVSCGPDWYPGKIMGCNGGYADGTFSFIEDYGAIPESCFPYTSGGGTVPPCSDKCANWQALTIHVVGCGLIQQGSQQSIKNALINYGPVSASFAVYQDFYDDYTGGIYVHTYGELVGYHRIAIVGYSDGNPGYWICKNSWGPDWGEDGWFRIAYGQCGIEDEVYYIDVGEGSGGNVEVTEYGNQYVASESSGDIKTWGSHGVELSQGGSSATAVYHFDNIVSIGVAEVGIYYNEIGSAGNGPDLYLYNFNSGSYDLIQGDTGDTSSLVWKWFATSNPSSYVSSSGLVKVKLFAEEDQGWPIPWAGDDVQLDSVGIRYIPKPLIPHLKAYSDPSSMVWTDVKAGESRTATIYVENIGDPGSVLYYVVSENYEWITCSKTSGSVSQGGKDSFKVTVQASSNKGETRSGTIVVKNRDNSGESTSFTVKIVTAKSRDRSSFFNLFNLLKARFPWLVTFFIFCNGLVGS